MKLHELTWGNTEAIVAITEKIGKREGFGAVLADGAGRAAERIDKGAEQYAVVVRGKSLPYHDPRMAPALGTAFFANVNPAHHMDCGVFGMLNNGVDAGDDPLPQAPKPPNPFGDYDKKGPLYTTGSAYHQLLNASGICVLYTTNMTPPPIAEFIAAVTGWDFGWEEGLKAGRRILTLRQAFNVREGLSPDKFELPKRIREEPLTTGLAAGVHIDFNFQRESYFTAMGWDINTGKPSANTLADLGLDKLVGDF